MEQERKCEAITTKRNRCRKKAELLRKYTDGREYLTCKLHDMYFRPHPSVAMAKMEKEAAANEGK